MARIRTIKPEFWTSEQIMELRPLTRLLFIGLWNFCDDRGVHPVAFKTLKAEVFPADDLLASDIEGMVRELIAAGLLGEFEENGRQWWFVTGWNHQVINRPSKSRYPEPPRIAPLPSAAGQDEETSDSDRFSDEFHEDSQSAHGALTEDSRTEGKGREGKGVNLKTISPAESVNNSTGVTPAGLVCARLKSECGISSGLNPQHPKLLALLAAGMTADELVSAGMDANGKGFAWVMAAAEGRRRDAEKVAGLPEARARASPSRQINGRQAAIDNYAAQAAAARGEHGKPERDITGESVRVA